MQLTDTLLHALLVACDQSYNLSPTQNQPLAPYLDTPNGDPATDLMPCWNLTDWTEVKRFDEAGTGFGAVV